MHKIITKIITQLQSLFYDQCHQVEGLSRYSPLLPKQLGAQTHIGG